MDKKKTIIFTITIVLYMFFLTPLFQWDIKIMAIATLLIIQILWVGRVFPLAYSSILLILILSFNFFSYDEVMSYVGTGIVWLLFSTFIIANAFIKTGLASRISLKILRLSKGSGSLLIFISFILMFVLTIFIPSNIGKSSLVASVLDGISNSLQKVSDVSNLSKALFIGISYVGAISCAFVATGASSTIYVYGMLQSISTEVTYLSWMFLFGPPIFIYIILLWLILTVYFPPGKIDRSSIIQLIDERLVELGKVQVGEKKMIAIISLTLLLWITQSWHGFSIPLVGMLGAALTISPLIGVWDWKEASEKVNWNIMIFFAATLMISDLLIKTGTVGWLVDGLSTRMENLSSYLVLLLLVISIALIRVVFVNVLGFLTIIIPVAIAIGENIPEINTLVVVMAVFLAGVPGFFLVTQSPVHLISYSFNHFTDRELLRIGFPSAIAWLVVVFLSVFYWQLVI
ncbi:SLC13 family permease [Virgibacillus kekensis]|uniref:Sodium-dependent dicarboxylate transporter SdcS n=1 Tax=Virgibacillus kekensis TaxID=202261 RepID=A0ABV9DIC4_9BACI